MAFIRRLYHEKIWRYQSVTQDWKLHSRITFRSPRGQWVNKIRFEQNDLHWADAFSCILSHENVCISIQSLFLRVQLLISQQWLGNIHVASHYLHQCWPRFVLPFNITGPSSVNKNTSKRKTNNLIFLWIREGYFGQILLWRTTFQLSVWCGGKLSKRSYFHFYQVWYSQWFYFQINILKFSVKCIFFP